MVADGARTDRRGPDRRRGGPNDREDVGLDGTAVTGEPPADHARRFAEVPAAIRALPPATLILDCEMAIFDDQLSSRFEWFRKRPEDTASTHPIHMAFDCLYLEGRRPCRFTSGEPNDKQSWRTTTPYSSRLDGLPPTD